MSLCPFFLLRLFLELLLMLPGTFDFFLRHQYSNLCFMVLGAEQEDVERMFYKT